MGKRKPVPQKLNATNQKSLSWSLGDSPTSSSGNINTGLGEDCNTDIDPEEHLVPARRPAKKARAETNESIENVTLQEFLKKSDFYVTIYCPKSSDVSCDSVGYILGEINLTVLEKFCDVSIPSNQLLYLYVGENCNNTCLLYWECRTSKMQEERFFWSVNCDWPYFALEALSMKTVFRVIFRNLSKDQSKVVILLHIPENSIQELEHPSQCYCGKADVHVQTIMKYLYNIIPNSAACRTNERQAAHDIEELYTAVRKMQRNFVDAAVSTGRDVQHGSLIPLLRPYQSEAVRWMLFREQVSPMSDANPESLHVLFEELETRDGKKLYYNKFGGFFVDKKPLRIPSSSGGILADEMGLGKTVEVLACVLLNPKVDDTKEMVEFIRNAYGEILTMENDIGKDDGREHSSVLQNALGDAESGVFGRKLIHDKSKQKLSKLQQSTKHFYERSVAPKTYFECICGSHSGGDDPEKIELQCDRCGLWQHAECVNFDLDKMLVPYRCPHCLVQSSHPLLPSKATLIVSPYCISSQWQEEIERHIRDGSLKVLVYNGVHSDGFIQPITFADYDIILTTYETLRRELQYVNLPHCNSADGRRFRKPKRFMALPSPLVAIKWWRICLDEAQMVEGTTTKAAEMVSNLTAVHKWCITGTPLQKTIDDLYGLLLFLREDPYSLKIWWKELLYEPYCYGMKEPLLKVLSQCFWRNSKKDVLNQIGIPPQTESINCLNFSPVESHFYMQQQEECTQSLLAALRPFPDLNINLKSLDKHTISLIMKPLRRLRQACCHPQVVRGQFLPIQNHMMTMEELLESLMKKAKNECEEAHRIVIASLNGLAAIKIIEQDYSEAVEVYRQVLRSVNEYKEVIKTDRLQQIHTLHNLAEVLDLCFSKDAQNTSEGGGKGASGNIANLRRKPTEPAASNRDGGKEAPASKPIGRTLRDENLRSEAEELRTSYLSKGVKQVNTAIQQLSEVTSKLKEMETEFTCPKSSPWWSELLSSFRQRRCDGDILIQKVKEDLINLKTDKSTTIVNRFSDVNGLLFVIVKQLDELQSSRDILTKAVNELSPNPSQAEVNDAAECHLRPVGKDISQCIYCKIHEYFNLYESKLFNFSEDEAIAEPNTKDEALMGNLRRGTWADSEVETILKSVLSYAKSQSVDRNLMNDGKLHKKLFVMMKKEFRALRAVWMEIRDFASAIDELNMATIRYRVRYLHEPKPDPPVPYILEKCDVQTTKMKLLSDRIIAQNEFKKKLGQFYYLQNLQKADLDGGGSNQELCPICQRELGIKWSVLQCGHCFCMDCIRIIIVNYACGGRSKSLQCAVCREMTPHADICYVRLKTDTSDDQEGYTVKGSFSSKVEGVVRCVLKIKDEDKGSKVLVFSTWQDVLDIISKAFDENGIRYVGIQSKNIKKKLRTFRQDPDISCLLLPLNLGANGLNLIEAKHVILVEPVLNPASELQACGRVHRIGQTKPTVLHRFIINDTIEERIYALLKPYMPCMESLEVDDYSMTLGELKALFTDKKSVM